MEALLIALFLLLRASGSKTIEDGSSGPRAAGSCYLKMVSVAVLDFVHFAACSQFAWTGRTYPISGRTAGTASAGDSTATPKAKPAAAKKAAAKGKAMPKQGKVGVFELARCKLSDLKEQSLPKYNRPESKKSIQNEIMNKAR